MPVLGHVDEVDDDEPGQIAQAQLPGDLVGGLEVGLDRGLVDMPLTGRLARIDVDRDQRLGRVHDDRAARRQLHGRAVHRVELVLDLVLEEERQLLLVELHVPGAGRHHHRHQPLGRAVRRLALDQDLVDVAAVEIAHRPLDQVALGVDQGRCHALERGVPDLAPLAHQVVVVALDLGARALLAGGPDDQPHALRHVELRHDRLQLGTVLATVDLAADPTAPGGVRHQDAVAAGEREIGGQRRTLGAALLLDDLHQHDLPALDHLLDLVGAEQLGAAPRLLAHHVRRLLLGVLAHLDGLVFLVLAVLAVLAAGPGIALTLAIRLGSTAAPARRLGRTVAIAAFGLGTLALQLRQKLAIGLRNLEIVGMDLAEGEKAVAVAAVLDERRLQRRLDPGHLGEVDIALELALGGGFEIEISELPVLKHDHPGLFRVVRIDEHALGHKKESPALLQPSG